MYLGIAVTVLVLLFVSVAHAQMTPSERIALEHALDGQGATQFQRLTSQGRFAGCEITYQHMFRDVRSGEKAGLVHVKGAIVSQWKPGKAFGLFVKAQPSRVRFSGDGKFQLTAFDPAYVSLTLGRLSFESYRRGRFTCEGGGECIAYGDGEKLEMLRDVVTNFMDSYVVLLTLNKGGFDYPISVAKLDDGPTVLMQFRECIGEIIEQMQKWVSRK